MIKSSLNLYGCHYKLCGVVLHLGTSVTSGHYIAFIKWGQFWFTCHDSVIRKVDFPPGPSGNEYLLFYTKDPVTLQ